MTHPWGWRARAGAKHGLDAMPVKQLDGAIEPIEIIDALARLQRAPGKLPHPHAIESRFLHQLCIDRPALLRPVLGVIGNAKVH